MTHSLYNFECGNGKAYYSVVAFYAVLSYDSLKQLQLKQLTRRCTSI